MENKPLEKRIQISNRVDELLRIESFLEELGEEWSLPVQLVLSLNLVLEEALNNIISYGYDDEGIHAIEVCLNKNGEIMNLTIIDDGHEYDPTARPDPDITLPASERPVGGLGIFLIKKFMDQVVYLRKENKNHLFLTKRIES